MTNHRPLSNAEGEEYRIGITPDGSRHTRSFLICCACSTLYDGSSGGVCPAADRFAETQNPYATADPDGGNTLAGGEPDRRDPSRAPADDEHSIDGVRARLLWGDHTFTADAPTKLLARFLLCCALEDHAERLTGQRAAGFDLGERLQQCEHEPVRYPADLDQWGPGLVFAFRGEDGPAAPPHWAPGETLVVEGTSERDARWERYMEEGVWTPEAMSTALQTGTRLLCLQVLVTSKGADRLVERLEGAVAGSPDAVVVLDLGCDNADGDRVDEFVEWNPDVALEAVRKLTAAGEVLP